MDPTTVLLLIVGSWTIGYTLGWVTKDYTERRARRLTVKPSTLDFYKEKRRREEMP